MIVLSFDNFKFKFIAAIVYTLFVLYFCGVVSSFFVNPIRIAHKAVKREFALLFRACIYALYAFVEEIFDNFLFELLLFPKNLLSFVEKFNAEKFAEFYVFHAEFFVVEMSDALHFCFDFKSEIVGETGAFKELVTRQKLGQKLNVF